MLIIIVNYFSWRIWQMVMNILQPKLNLIKNLSAKITCWKVMCNIALPENIKSILYNMNLV